MIEKIKSALKTKYQSMGFSDEAFNGVASLVSKIVTEESQIAAVVDGAEVSLKGFQSDVDRRVNAINGEKTQLEADKLALEEKLKESPKPPSTPQVGNEGDSKILEVVQELQKKIEGFETKQTQEQQLQSKNALLESAEALMIKEGVNQKFVRQALNNVELAEGETAETLGAKGVAEHNKLQSLYSPSAGQPYTSDDTGGKSIIELYAEKKGAETKK